MPLTRRGSGAGFMFRFISYNMRFVTNTTEHVRLKIDSLAYGPHGIGRHEGRAVFIPMTVPGDEAEVRIVEEKKNYAVGELANLIRPSADRQTPPCPYVGA